MMNTKVLIVSHINQPIIPFPAISVDDAGLFMFLQSGMISVQDLALTKKDAKDRLFACASSAFEFVSEALDARCAKVAFILSNIPNHPLKLLELTMGNGRPEQTVIEVDCVIIDVGEQDGLAGRNINATAPHNSFQSYID